MTDSYSFHEARRGYFPAAWSWGRENAMHRICLLLVLGLTMGACDVGTQTGEQPTRIYATMTTKSLDGRETNTFRSGENFIVSCYWRNVTQGQLSIEYTGTPAQFEIVQHDSVISHFLDGWATIVSYDTVGPGGTVGTYWIGPTNVQHDPITVLEPGIYTIRTGWIADGYPVPLARPTPMQIVIVP